ncbi:MAG: HAD family hydrolase [Methanobacteriaceae archaeon]|jgi:Cu+-exporting ATPase|nr:HAD family hydrolase [Methanobacteriaceae archaeon]
MDKKAVVFDNSGTLVKRFRVIKNLETGEFCPKSNSLKIVDRFDGLALVVLQFNTTCLKKQNPNIRLYDLIKFHNIRCDISYHKSNITSEDVINILKKDKIIVKDITDGFDILARHVKNIELCNGSAIILDNIKNKVAFTISSAGHFFPNTKETIETLKKRGIEVFIASGDRAGTINTLTEFLAIEKDNGYSTATTKRKQEIVQELQSKGYKVMMVGDGINDILAFEAADISILTLEQIEEVDEKLLNTTDFTIHDIKEVLDIDF